MTETAEQEQEVSTKPNLKFRAVVLSVTGALSAAGLIAAKDYWPIAVLLALVIVLGVVAALLVADKIHGLEHTLAQHAREIQGCEGEREECRNELQLIQVLCAMFYVHANTGTPRRGRRKSDKMPAALENAFVRTLGQERARSVLEQAQKLLSTPN